MILRGFYAVLDRDDEALAGALASVACALQVRLKPRGGSVTTAELVAVARMARRICDVASIPLIVNDRIDVALAVGADAVHLGQTDLPFADARRLAGSRLAIGVSTHDLDQVHAACAAGADYLGFGPVFATTTKLNPDPVQGLEALRAAAASANVPVVAIGGITPGFVRDIYAAGASAICAISAVNDPDPERTRSAALRYCQ
ncbi:MAG: thiamine phosphate synthase [Kofleriaceae bacterium]